MEAVTTSITLLISVIIFTVGIYIFTDNEILKRENKDLKKLMELVKEYKEYWYNQCSKEVEENTRLVRKVVSAENKILEKQKIIDLYKLMLGEEIK